MDQASEQSTEAAAQALLDGGHLDSFLGETPEPEQKDAPETEQAEAEQPEPEVSEVETDDSDAVEDEDNEEDDDSEEVEADEGESSDDEEQESNEQIEIESADQLAQALGVSTDDLLDNLRIDVVIDGERQSVTLRDAQAGYQKDADYRRKTSELATQRREFEQQAQQKHQEVEFQHQVAAQMLLYAEKQLAQEADPQALAELRQSDPMAWTAKYAELTERKQQLQQLKQQAAQAYMQHTQQAEQEQKEKFDAKLAEEAEALQRLIPNFKEVKPQLEGYLSESYGYSPEDMGMVADHRIIDLARKAMLYDQQQAKAKEVKKKVKAAPKMQKPGKKAAPKNPQTEKLRVSKSRLKKSGSLRDAASVFESFI